MTKLQKICMELNCEAECLNKSHLCYLHNHVLKPQSYKNKQLYEIIHEIEYKQNNYNILNEFTYNYDKTYIFTKSWINDYTYTYIYI